MAVTAQEARNIGQCTIAVDDADGDLPADSHVTVTVTIDTHRHSLAIPRAEALHTEGTGRFVYCVVDGKLEKTAVKVGLSSLLKAEITSGLLPRTWWSHARRMAAISQSASRSPRSVKRH